MQKFLDQDRVDAVLAFRAKLGRPFEPQDLTGRPNLARAARDFALDSVGDSFAYLAEMAQNVSLGSFLTPGQAKGVLNVLVARASRTPRPSSTPARPSQPTLNLSDVPSARYRVTATDGSSISVRLEDAAWATNKPKGTRSVAILIGADDWFGLGFISPTGDLQLWRKADAHKPRLLPALETLAKARRDGDWLVYALAYAQEGSECAFCGRNLDTAESISVGYGPTCAKKHGLPWGAKAVPMAVLLAKGAAAPESDAHDLDADDRVQPGDVPEDDDDRALDSDPYDLDQDEKDHRRGLEIINAPDLDRRPWTLPLEQRARYFELFGKDA